VPQDARHVIGSHRLRQSIDVVGFRCRPASHIPTHRLRRHATSAAMSKLLNFCFGIAFHGSGETRELSNVLAPIRVASRTALDAFWFLFFLFFFFAPKLPSKCLVCRAY